MDAPWIRTEIRRHISVILFFRDPKKLRFVDQPLSIFHDVYTSHKIYHAYQAKVFMPYQAKGDGVKKKIDLSAVCSWGLRLSETLNLQVSDSRRRMIQVQRGKGVRDR
jgi:hypothetical protein